MAVLIGERPEEVTDIMRHVRDITGGLGDVAASNFDEPPGAQTRVGELALERAKRLLEKGQDVVMVLDSITRMARAYNLALPTSGRTLTGGFDPQALFPAKKFFGAARKIEDGGSLTIIGTCLVNTGSRMDDIIYEEFKGTGNMELHLDRRLADKRIYPAIDVTASGTRQEELLYGKEDLQKVHTLRRMLEMIHEDERTETLLERLKKSDSNKEFLDSLKTV
jgi:transcription termination factor Rho